MNILSSNKLNEYSRYEAALMHPPPASIGADQPKDNAINRLQSQVKTKGELSLRPRGCKYRQIRLVCS